RGRGSHLQPRRAGRRDRQVAGSRGGRIQHSSALSSPCDDVVAFQSTSASATSISFLSRERACGAHAPSVYRLCRALANAGVFEEHDGKRLSLTPMGECLRGDVSGSMAGMAKMFGERWHAAAWAELLHSVRTGEPAFPKVYGEGLFEWFGTRREEAE